MLLSAPPARTFCLSFDYFPIYHISTEVLRPSK